MDLFRHDATPSTDQSQLPVWRYAHSRHEFDPCYVRPRVESKQWGANSGEFCERKDCWKAVAGLKRCEQGNKKNPKLMHLETGSLKLDPTNATEN